MNRVRETTTTTVTTNADHERNLDALLEDLQTTVSRSNSTLNLNGGMTTGYREMRRTYTDGTPEGTMTEYQIEYLNPANTTQHIAETSYNGMQNPGSHRMKSVTNYKYNTVETGSGSGDMKMKQNISELDSLLDDLNTAQKKNFAESTTISSRNVSRSDSGMTDHGGSHSMVRNEQRHYNEDKSLRGRSPSARKELVFTGQRSQDPSPIREQMYFEQHDQSPKVQQFYRYEKTTSTRTTGPTMVDAAPLSPDTGNLQSNTVRNYTYTDESPLPIRHRSPSPGGVHSYHYSSSTTSRDMPHPQSPPLDKYRTYPDEYPTRPGTTSYNYSNTMRETRSDVRGKTPPPPHRSPSPVSFSQPPPPIRSTTVKTYTYDQQTGSDGVPRSPSPGPKFSPSDPSHNRLTYNVSPGPPSNSSPHHTSTITNYKYTTTQHHQHLHNQQPEETVPLMPRPFPTPQPTPINPHSDQQPPKKLDELMASFSDADHPRHNRYTETTVHHYTNTNSTPHPPPQAIRLHPSNENEKLIEKEREIQREQEKEKIEAVEESKNVSGPPVYYPPGVELFAKKDESMMMQQQSGGGKYRAKAKYEYESKSKSKMSESSGKAVVPVCLPLCCAMPCVIM